MSGGGTNFTSVQKFVAPSPGQLSQGLGDFVGDLTGTNRMSDAVGAAANAQLAQQGADRTLAMQLAGPSEMELAQLEQAIKLNTQEISRKQKLLDSSDPALIEAGHQALALMQGKSAASLAPIQNERTQQRKQLENTLAQRLGPDYAQSSAGLQALNDFDRQTGNLMTQAQQSSLAQFLGVAGNMQSFGNMAGNTQAAAALSAQRGTINTRQLGALFGSPVNPGMAYAGDISRLGAQSQYLNQFFQDSYGAGKKAMGSMAGGAPGAAGAGAGAGGSQSAGNFVAAAQPSLMA